MSTIHNKLISFTAMEYIKKELEEEHIYNKPFLQRLHVSLKGYLVFHRLSDEEAKVLAELGKQPTMVRLQKEEINYGLFALELLTLHLKHLTINISKRKIAQYKSNSIMDILSLKKRDPEMYTRVKSTVQDSRLTAKLMYHYTEEYLNDNSNQMDKQK